MAIGGEFTKQLLEDGGLGPKMCVLEVRCVTGDVSLLAAEIVGSSG